MNVLHVFLPAREEMLGILLIAAELIYVFESRTTKKNIRGQHISMSPTGKDNLVSLVNHSTLNTSFCR